MTTTGVYRRAGHMIPADLNAVVGEFTPVVECPTCSALLRDDEQVITTHQRHHADPSAAGRRARRRR